MIGVVIGNNWYRKTVIVDPNTPVKEVIKDQDPELIIQLDGLIIPKSDLEKTFLEHGIKDFDYCFLSLCVKAGDYATSCRVQEKLEKLLKKGDTQ